MSTLESIIVPRQEGSLYVSPSEFIEEASSMFLRAIPEERENIQAVVSTANSLLQELDLSDELWDFTNPNTWDKAFISLAMAHRWNQDISFAERYQLSESLLLLFLYDLDAEFLERHGVPEHKHIPFPVIVEMVTQIWPEPMQSITTEDEFFGFLRDQSIDGIVRLPYALNPSDAHQKSMKDFYNSVLVACGYTEDDFEKRAFTGLAFPHQQLILLWEDSSELTELHEEAHIEGKGLRVGGLGKIFNEGLTELRAIFRWSENMEIIDIPLEIIDQRSRRDEMIITMKVLAKDLRLGRALIEHCDIHSVMTSRMLAYHLVKNFGLDLYRRLYTVGEECGIIHLFPELIPSDTSQIL